MTDHALDALLAEYIAPPVPASLAARVAAAALALPQEPRRLAARPRHDRRKAWLRWPLLIGGVALGLAVSGAVAASLAGVRLDRLPIVAAVLAELRGSPPEVAPPQTPPSIVAPPPVVEQPLVEQPIEAPREARSTAVPRAAPPRDEAPPVIVPVEVPRPPEAAVPRPIEAPPPPPLPPVSAPRDEAVAATPAPAPERSAIDETRLQRERIERAERQRVARQAQIERLQRIQERRERTRRLRRD